MKKSPFGRAIVSVDAETKHRGIAPLEGHIGGIHSDVHTLQTVPCYPESAPFEGRTARHLVVLEFILAAVAARHPDSQMELCYSDTSACAN